MRALKNGGDDTTLSHGRGQAFSEVWTMFALFRRGVIVRFGGIASFCALGFLSAAELPGAAGSVRLLHGVVGVAALSGVGWLAWLWNSEAAATGTTGRGVSSKSRA